MSYNPNPISFCAACSSPIYVKSAWENTDIPPQPWYTCTCFGHINQVDNSNKPEFEKNVAALDSEFAKNNMFYDPSNEEIQRLASEIDELKKDQKKLSKSLDKLIKTIDKHAETSKLLGPVSKPPTFVLKD